MKANLMYLGVCESVVTSSELFSDHSYRLQLHVSRCHARSGSLWTFQGLEEKVDSECGSFMRISQFSIIQSSTSSRIQFEVSPAGQVAVKVTHESPTRHFWLTSWFDCSESPTRHDHINPDRRYRD